MTPTQSTRQTQTSTPTISATVIASPTTSSQFAATPDNSTLNSATTQPASSRTTSLYDILTSMGFTSSVVTPASLESESTTYPPITTPVAVTKPVRHEEHQSTTSQPSISVAQTLEPPSDSVVHVTTLSSYSSSMSTPIPSVSSPTTLGIDTRSQFTSRSSTHTSTVTSPPMSKTLAYTSTKQTVAYTSTPQAYTATAVTGHSTTPLSNTSPTTTTNLALTQMVAPQPTSIPTQATLQVPTTGNSIAPVTGVASSAVPAVPYHTVTFSKSQTNSTVSADITASPVNTNTKPSTTLSKSTKSPSQPTLLHLAQVTGSSEGTSTNVTVSSPTSSPLTAPLMVDSVMDSPSTSIPTSTPYASTKQPTTLEPTSSVSHITPSPASTTPPFTPHITPSPASTTLPFTPHITPSPASTTPPFKPHITPSPASTTLPFTPQISSLALKQPTNENSHSISATSASNSKAPMAGHTPGTSAEPSTPATFSSLETTPTSTQLKTSSVVPNISVSGPTASASVTPIPLSSTAHTSPSKSLHTAIKSIATGSTEKKLTVVPLTDSTATYTLSTSVGSDTPPAQVATSIATPTVSYNSYSPLSSTTSVTTWPALTPSTPLPAEMTPIQSTRQTQTSTPTISATVIASPTTSSQFAATPDNPTLNSATTQPASSRTTSLYDILTSMGFTSSVVTPASLESESTTYPPITTPVAVTKPVRHEEHQSTTSQPSISVAQTLEPPSDSVVHVTTLSSYSSSMSTPIPSVSSPTTLGIDTRSQFTSRSSTHTSTVTSPPMSKTLAYTSTKQTVAYTSTPQAYTATAVTGHSTTPLSNTSPTTTTNLALTQMVAPQPTSIPTQATLQVPTTGNSIAPVTGVASSAVPAVPYHTVTFSKSQTNSTVSADITASPVNTNTKPSTTLSKSTKSPSQPTLLHLAQVTGSSEGTSTNVTVSSPTSSPLTAPLMVDSVMDSPSTSIPTSTPYASTKQPTTLEPTSSVSHITPSPASTTPPFTPHITPSPASTTLPFTPHITPSPASTTLPFTPQISSLALKQPTTENSHSISATSASNSKAPMAGHTPGTSAEPSTPATFSSLETTPTSTQLKTSSVVPNISVSGPTASASVTPIPLSSTAHTSPSKSLHTAIKSIATGSTEKKLTVVPLTDSTATYTLSTSVGSDTPPAQVATSIATPTVSYNSYSPLSSTTSVTTWPALTPSTPLPAEMTPIQSTRQTQTSTPTISATVIASLTTSRQFTATPDNPTLNSATTQPASLRTTSLRTISMGFTSSVVTSASLESKSTTYPPITTPVSVNKPVHHEAHESTTSQPSISVARTLEPPSDSVGHVTTHTPGTSVEPFVPAVFSSLETTPTSTQRTTASVAPNIAVEETSKLISTTSSKSPVTTTPSLNTPSLTTSLNSSVAYTSNIKATSAPAHETSRDTLISLSMTSKGDVAPRTQLSVTATSSTESSESASSSQDFGNETQVTSISENVPLSDTISTTSYRNTSPQHTLTSVSEDLTIPSQDAGLKLSSSSPQTSPSVAITKGPITAAFSTEYPITPRSSTAVDYVTSPTPILTQSTSRSVLDLLYTTLPTTIKVTIPSKSSFPPQHSSTTTSTTTTTSYTSKTSTAHEITVPPTPTHAQSPLPQTPSTMSPITHSVQLTSLFAFLSDYVQDTSTQSLTSSPKQPSSNAAHHTAVSVSSSVSPPVSVSSCVSPPVSVSSSVSPQVSVSSSASPPVAVSSSVSPPVAIYSPLTSSLQPTPRDPILQFSNATDKPSTSTSGQYTSADGVGSTVSSKPTTNPVSADIHDFPEGSYTDMASNSSTLPLTASTTDHSTISLSGISSMSSEIPTVTPSSTTLSTTSEMAIHSELLSTTKNSAMPGESSTSETAYTSMPDISMTTETPVTIPQPMTTQLSTDPAIPSDGSAYTSMPDNSMTTETPVNTQQPMTTPLSTDAAISSDGSATQMPTQTTSFSMATTTSHTRVRTSSPREPPTSSVD
ncbi:mucin-2-like [Clupea harengus]|uniref:Mucin-2-like n=1 Tax=Clupea harengus TaxID=7950 RepID=A0A8M1KXK1_CLUHA|nr:mucin-2-like [Clupea harengus]